MLQPSRYNPTNLNGGTVPFDDIPEDYRPSYPCENCGEGNITESEYYPGCWECDTCGWSHPCM